MKFSRSRKSATVRNCSLHPCGVNQSFANSSILYNFTHPTHSLHSFGSASLIALPKVIIFFCEKYQHAIASVYISLRCYHVRIFNHNRFLRIERFYLGGCERPISLVARTKVCHGKKLAYQTVTIHSCADHYKYIVSTRGLCSLRSLMPLTYCSLQVDD